MPTPPPSIIASASRGSIDTHKRELVMVLADGDRVIYDERRALLIRRSEHAPAYNETPLLPGIAPDVVDFMADVYRRAARLLRHRRRAAVRFA